MTHKKEIKNYFPIIYENLWESNSVVLKFTNVGAASSIFFWRTCTWTRQFDLFLDEDPV